LTPVGHRVPRLVSLVEGSKRRLGPFIVASA
jgi:hypothetical protein